MKSYFWKTALLGVGVIVAFILFVLCFSQVFAMPQTFESQNSANLMAPSQRGPWLPVYEEKMTDGKTWYAYAKCEEQIWTKIKDGQIFTLRNQKGEKFQAKIKIHKPIPNPQSAGGRSPGRIWVDFERTGPGTSKILKVGLAVIFKVW